MKFRKKPVVIEAWLFDGSVKSFRAIPFSPAPAVFIRRQGHPANQIDIPTLEGVMTANVGDWIIKGVKGEFYPCKPDIFAATYEPVETDGIESHTLDDIDAAFGAPV